MNDIKISLRTWASQFENDATAQAMRKIAAEQPGLLGCSTDFNMGKVKESLPVLRGLMEQYGISLQDELQILLILEHPDFYLLQNRAAGSITGVEISVAAKRLHQKTGLTIEVIYKQLAVLCYAVQIRFVALEVPTVAPENIVEGQSFEDMVLNSEGVPSFGYILPAGLYEEQKKELDSLFVKKAYETLVQKASVLCSMDIPTAVFYTGYCSLYGLGTDQNITRGVEFLKAAARGGEMRAWNVLGDYYRSVHCKDPKKNELAYRCYTIFGGEPLTGSQRERINTMREDRKRYAGNWLFSGLFLIFMVAFVVLSIIIAGPARLVFGIIALVLGAAIFGTAFFLQKKHPHTDIIRYAIPAMYGVFLIYLFIWIVSLAA